MQVKFDGIDEKCPKELFKFDQKFGQQNISYMSLKLYDWKFFLNMNLMVYFMTYNIYFVHQTRTTALANARTSLYYVINVLLQLLNVSFVFYTIVVPTN
jgi:hypothetical protein